MEQLLIHFRETIAGSADTVAMAADLHQRREGLVEAPNEHTHKAAALRARLQNMHAAVGAVASEASPDDAAALLSLAREVLGGVWSNLWTEVSQDAADAYTHVHEQRHSYARQGAAWMWALLGRALGVPAANSP